MLNYWQRPRTATSLTLRCTSTVISRLTLRKVNNPMRHAAHNILVSTSHPRETHAYTVLNATSNSGVINRKTLSLFPALLRLSPLHPSRYLLEGLAAPPLTNQRPMLPSYRHLMRYEPTQVPLRRSSVRWATELVTKRRTPIRYVR